jgi:hypothetical protein
MTGNGSNAGAAAGGGAVYGIGMIGAFLYFISTATSFWDGLYGVFQALFWPAYLVFEAFDSLGA